MKNAFIKMRGFTLVEILVVLAIISVLASVVMVSVSGARENARIKSEKATVAQMELYLKLYKENVGGYPPSTASSQIDNCSLCYLRPSSYNFSTGEDRWEVVADALTPLFTTQPLYTDAWGMPYAYDNNYKVSGSQYYSALCSLGPDGVLQTFLVSSNYLLTVPNPQTLGDDICFFTR
jgi:general secretion pathway protein G